MTRWVYESVDRSTLSSQENVLIITCNNNGCIDNGCIDNDWPCRRVQCMTLSVPVLLRQMPHCTYTYVLYTIPPVSQPKTCYFQGVELIWRVGKRHVLSRHARVSSRKSVGFRQLFPTNRSRKIKWGNVTRYEYTIVLLKH